MSWKIVLAVAYAVIVVSMVLFVAISKKEPPKPPRRKP